MQQQPQPPKDRVKRPEMPNFQQFNQPTPQNNEPDELSQDDFNEWVFRKIVRLDLNQMRKEEREGQKFTEQLKQPPPKSKIPPQPYEQVYGPTEDELVADKKIPKPKKKDGKRLIYLVIFIAIACAIGYYAYKILVEGYSFGYLPAIIKTFGA